MPFTFLAHQAVVLPVKLARPRWVSGTALVLGSMAPDFEYFLRGDSYGTVGHTLLGQLTFCLPLTIFAVFVVRSLALTVGRELPDLGAFHLRDVAFLRSAPIRIVPLLLGAILGSLSHVAWDGFTHADGWAVERLPALGWPVYKVLQHGSTLVGATITLVLLRAIGKRRLLVKWAGLDPEALPVLPGPSWMRRAILGCSVLVGALAGALTGVALDGEPLRVAVCAALRAALGGAVGLVVGSVLSRRTSGGR